MAVFTVSGGPSGYALAASTYGGNGWSPGSGNVVSVIPFNQGSAWIYWSVKNTAIPPGLPFTGVNIKGGSDFSSNFQTRTGKLFARVSKAADFVSAGGTQIDSFPGTGVGHQTNATIGNGSITSDDLIAGNVFIGLAVSTDAVDTGNGTFRCAAFNWTLTFGEPPIPPGGTIGGTLVNPVGNYIPGKVATQQFAGLDYTLTQPVPQSFMTITWTINGPAGIKFAANNSQTLAQSKGTSADPADPAHGNCGPINIAQGTVAGNYTITCFPQISSPSSSQTLVGNLNVIQSPGGMFGEF
jgi:hypothetical protein